MADNSTLMAYLVPKLTVQVENAATDALAYILNRSAGSMQALNELLREGGFNIKPIARVATQVSYEDGSRPDMAGYDKGNAVRLLVEAKFWAALLEGQASGYAQWLDQSGPAALLFVAPEVRIPTLWMEIRRQMEGQGGLEILDAPPGVQRAKVKDTERHVMLVSWVRLLDRVEALAGDDAVRSDIRQLRGLVQEQDAQPFLPIHSEELGPNLGRLLFWFAQLADHVVDSQGVPEGWMDVQGLKATAQRYGYGRHFRFRGAERASWFGVNHERWSSNADTPLWLCEYDASWVAYWTPIYPKLGVEYQEVLDDVAAQLRAIGEHRTAE